MKIRNIQTATILAILLCAPLVPAEDTIVTIEVQAGDYLRQHTPVFLRLPAEVGDDRQLVMQRVEDRKRIGIQRIVSDKPMIAWMIEKPLGAGLSRKYKLLAVDRLAAVETVESV